MNPPFVAVFLPLAVAKLLITNIVKGRCLLTQPLGACIMPTSPLSVLPILSGLTTVLNLMLVRRVFMLNIIILIMVFSPRLISLPPLMLMIKPSISLGPEPITTTIQTVFYKARSILIHASLCWPDEITLDLWPFALDYAVWLYNCTPGRISGLSPEELFTGSSVDWRYLRRARVWGCPTYVLNPRLQDGGRLPKWEPQARTSQFLVFSRNHSSTLGLIRNICTGSISPQYHVDYDDAFSTVPSPHKSNQVDFDLLWSDLLRTSRRVSVFADAVPEDGPLLFISWPLSRLLRPLVAPPPPCSSHSRFYH
jgi:hypothetical protein